MERQEIAGWGGFLAITVPGPAGPVILVAAFVGVIAVMAVWQLGAIAEDFDRTGPRSRFKRGWSRVRAWPRKRRRNSKPGTDL
jgi:hypothetical protein